MKFWNNLRPLASSILLSAPTVFHKMLLFITEACRGSVRCHSLDFCVFFIIKKSMIILKLGYFVSSGYLKSMVCVVLYVLLFCILLESYMGREQRYRQPSFFWPSKIFPFSFIDRLNKVLQLSPSSSLSSTWRGIYCHRSWTLSFCSACEVCSCLFSLPKWDLDFFWLCCRLALLSRANQWLESIHLVTCFPATKSYY